MLREIFELGKTSCRFQRAYYGFRKFSSLHSNLANTIISSYCDKNKRSSLKQSAYVYIRDPETANSIASYVTKDWKGGYILEANPGPGILTSSILNYGNCHLRVFEKTKDFFPSLELLCSLHPTLEVIQEDLMLLPLIDARASSEPSYLEQFYRNIPEYSWNGGIPFRVFSVIASKQSVKFLRYLLAVLPKKSSLFTFGRCEFFLFTKEREFMYMDAVPKENFATYRWSTVLYNLFFDFELLEKFSSESLFPCRKSNKKRLCIGDNFYLIKLTPRLDLFSGLVTENKLQEFYFFVRHHLVKRSALVIPTLEGWIPLCGPRLIKEGMNVFRRFGDLSPQQILLLFNQFSSWPEYKDSAFQAAAVRYYRKEVFSYEDDDDDD